VGNPYEQMLRHVEKVIILHQLTWRDLVVLSFIKYLPNISYEPGTVQSIRNTAKNKTRFVACTVHS
jgi:hypothetical protein